MRFVIQLFKTTRVIKKTQTRVSAKWDIITSPRYTSPRYRPTWLPMLHCVRYDVNFELQSRLNSLKLQVCGNVWTVFTDITRCLFGLLLSKRSTLRMSFPLFTIHYNTCSWIEYLSGTGDKMNQSSATTYTGQNVKLRTPKKITNATDLHLGSLI